MKIGVPREQKDSESRVAITPAGVREFVVHNHEVIIERDAGRGSSIFDSEFERAGAVIVPNADVVFAEADMVLKVKEPIEEEFHRLRDGLILFTYLHLAASDKVTTALLESKATGVAYETVEYPDGSLPLLAPMSEVAGRMAPQVGAHFLEREYGGRGILMGGVSGVAPARVVVIGAGMSGMNAAWIAQGMEAEVLVLVKDMKPGAVVVDISIDQGGCFETSRMTTHSDPTYVVHDVVHYCVGNMPGAVPNTSTYALTNVTLPYALDIAQRGMEDAVRIDPTLASGVNV